MDNDYDLLPLLLAILLACPIVWQLASGHTLGVKKGWREIIVREFRKKNSRNDWFTLLFRKNTPDLTIIFREDVSREHNPWQYWLTVLFQVVLLVIVVINNATS